MTATHAQIADAAEEYRAAVEALADAQALVADRAQVHAEAVTSAAVAMNEARAKRQDLLVLIGALEPEHLGLDTNLD